MISTRTPQDLLATIQQWEHWPIIQQVAAKEYGLTPAEFYTLLPEYQKFLVLAGIAPHNLGMFSQRIDKIWHSHVLYLHLYESFCQTYFGRLLYHAPNLKQQSAECTQPEDICTDKECGTCKTDPGKCTNGECDEECEYSAGHGAATLSRFIAAYREAFGTISPLWSVSGDAHVS
jgi:hypothetical protein